MNMIITDHTIHIQVIQLTDRIDAFTVPDLREEFQGLLEQGVSRFVIDLTDVTFLDSAGMAALVSLLRRARQADGDVRLVWPQLDAARRILHLTKFDRVFEICDTANDALKRGWH